MTKMAHIRSRAVANEAVLEFKGEVPRTLRVGHPVTVCGAFPYTWYDDTSREMIRSMAQVRAAEAQGHTVIALYRELD